MAQGLQRGREPRARPVVGGLFDGPKPPEERRPEAQARFTCRAASGAVEARRAPECEIRIGIPEIAVPEAARAWLSRAVEDGKTANVGETGMEFPSPGGERVSGG